MKTLKAIALTLVQVVIQIWFLPRTWARVVQQREQEAERLDRIRNPSKYVGR